MRKGILQTNLLLVVLFLSLGFTSSKKANVLIKREELPVKIHTVTIAKEMQKRLLLPLLDKKFIAFKEALAFKESQGNYFITNDLGYMGKYQFGKATLKMLGITRSSVFLKDPSLQEKAFVLNTSRNKWILRKDIRRYAGRRVHGIKVTESGILAAAHLGGPGNVKKFLRSAGRVNFSDAYGTSIAYYMKKFSGYDVSCISAIKNPRL